MPFNNSNSKENKSKSFGKNKIDSKNFDPELITAYIDLETSPIENEIIENYLSVDEKIKIQHDFEKKTKEVLRNKVKRIETPQYLYNNIYNSIDDYCKNVNSKNHTKQNLKYPTESIESGARIYSEERKHGQFIPGKYVYILGGVFTVLIVFFIILNFFPGKNVYADNDFVAISRNIFEKLEAGDMKMDLATSNASTLENYLENKTGYDVYVPDVKNAVLIGGVINEFQGQKIIYFVHRKNNKVICTLEANRTELFKEDKLFLPENHKEKILSGKNWFPCMKSKTENTMIWHKDNIICTSVSKIESNEICAILTNCK